MRNSLVFAAGVFLLTTQVIARPAGSPPVPDLPAPGGGDFKQPRVVGWPEGMTPDALPGFTVERFADGFQSGRWPYVLPNGDVLISQARTETMGGFPPEVIESLTKQGFFGPSADNVILVRQGDAGTTKSVFIDGLNQPFGILLHRGWLYIANTDSLVRFRYREGQVRIDGPADKLLDIPAGEKINPWNNHWTRNLIASADGNKLYLSVGSATDVNAEGNEHPERAAIWELNLDGSGKRLFATGLRNPVGLALHPETGELWTTVNERDGLGSDVPPDYLTRGCRR
jgi:glucose/arabinose dehydrogenase